MAIPNPALLKKCNGTTIKNIIKFYGHSIIVKNSVSLSADSDLEVGDPRAWREAVLASDRPRRRRAASAREETEHEDARPFGEDFRYHNKPSCLIIFPCTECDASCFIIKIFPISIFLYILGEQCLFVCTVT